MTPQRWQEVKKVLAGALDRTPEERSVYLDQACREPALRREVESLIAAHEQGDSNFMEQPTLNTAPLKSGTKLGPYEILAPLGAGGMGEVYEARDTKLGRKVAIKTLPAAFVNDPERLARFQREARMLASLNHPNIATIHGQEESGGVHFLVMELIPGQTLAERLRTGPLTTDETLAISRQIADALEAAHDNGLIHRDLKPANVKVTPDGRVKVLDFGLAKAFAGDGGLDLSHAPTLTAMGTEEGRILGTPAYMSPEQARGKPVDRRTDIWAFGCVLYELLTGRRAFSGETISDTIAAILEHEPDWSALPETTPASIRRLLQRCVEKDAKRRLRDIGDARVELEEALAAKQEISKARPAIEDTTAATSAKMPRSRTWVAVAAVLVVLVGAPVLWRAKHAGAGLPPIHSIAVLPLQNFSSDPQQEYFSDGTTEALISDLAQIHALKVISRTSVMRYKQTTKGLPQIGRELGVDAIVEGSVQRVGERVRISVQLVRAATDTHLWASDYDRDTADELRLEADVARAIAQEIRAQVTPEEKQRLASARTVQPAAHDEYLMGNYRLHEGGPVGLKESIEHFRRAIQIQPDYAVAYAGLSMAWMDLGNLSEERLAAQKAFELDPNDPEVYVALTCLNMLDWDWTEAQKNIQKALALDPNSLDACDCNAQFLQVMGHLSEALAVVERTAQSDPLSANTQLTYAGVLYEQRRYEDAILRDKKALELAPRAYFAHVSMGFAYAQLGRYQEAVAEVDRPEFRSSPYLARVYAMAGRREDALKLVPRLTRLAARFDEPAMAMMFFDLGDRDRGFQWLTRAFDHHGPTVPFVPFDPDFDNVRSDPRFQALVARLKIPD